MMNNQPKLAPWLLGLGLGFGLLIGTADSTQAGIVIDDVIIREIPDPSFQYTFRLFLEAGTDIEGGDPEQNGGDFITLYGDREAGRDAAPASSLPPEVHLFRTKPRAVSDLIYAEFEPLGQLNNSFIVMQGPRGTARAVGLGAPYEMAGKSGTAQVFSVAQEEEYNEEEVAERLRDHALFIAFAPLEQPQIAVAVIVENGSSGSRVAAPIAKAIMDEYLGYDGFGDVPD